ncbi:hypothetical protein RBWH47_05570 [Rhodopirellula baltica WH47]|uniref:Uncharacterized protein n=1 Tax=Rhodopirellula baltica WH47 TaxID=991778 RepID=F2AM11_RHOBT|nr:hypothetical protein RBWH47_05570 [Rhodopirellula baltica WH47]
MQPTAIIDQDVRKATKSKAESNDVPVSRTTKAKKMSV